MQRLKALAFGLALIGLLATAAYKGWLVFSTF